MDYSKIDLLTTSYDHMVSQIIPLIGAFKPDDKLNTSVVSAMESKWFANLKDSLALFPKREKITQADKDKVFQLYYKANDFISYASDYMSSQDFDYTVKKEGVFRKQLSEYTAWMHEKVGNAPDRYAPEMPPELPEYLVPLPISDDEGEPYTKVVAKGKKLKKNSGDKPIKIHLGTKSVSAEHDNSLTIDELFIPTDANFPWASEGLSAGAMPTIPHQKLIFKPARSKPYLNGKAVPFDKVKEYKASELEWKEFDPVGFIETRGINMWTLIDLRSRNWIMECSFEALVKVVPNEGQFQELKLLTPDECREKGYTSFDFAAAYISALGGDCQEMLRKHDLGTKSSFIDKQFTRLLKLQPIFVDVFTPVEIFRHFLKKDLKEKQSINKTFYTLSCALLSTWKKSETRTEYLKRIDKTLKVYWESDKDKVIENFKKTKHGSKEVKADMSSVGRFLHETKNQAREKAKAMYDSFASTVKEKSEPIVEAVKEEKAKFDEVKEHVPASSYWWSRVKQKSISIGTAVLAAPAIGVSALMAPFTFVGNALGITSKRVLTTGGKYKEVPRKTSYLSQAMYDNFGKPIDWAFKGTSKIFAKLGFIAESDAEPLFGVSNTPVTKRVQAVAVATSVSTYAGIVWFFGTAFFAVSLPVGALMAATWGLVWSAVPTPTYPDPPESE